MQAQALLQQQIKDAAYAKIIVASPFEDGVCHHREEVKALFQQYGKVSFSFQQSHYTAALADKETKSLHLLRKWRKVCCIMGLFKPFQAHLNMRLLIGGFCQTTVPLPR